MYIIEKQTPNQSPIMLCKRPKELSICWMWVRGGIHYQIIKKMSLWGIEMCYIYCLALIKNNNNSLTIKLLIMKNIICISNSDFLVEFITIISPKGKWIFEQTFIFTSMNLAINTTTTKNYVNFKHPILLVEFDKTSKSFGNACNAASFLSLIKRQRNLFEISSLFVIIIFVE